VAKSLAGNFTYLTGIVIVFYFGSSAVRDYLRAQGGAPSQPTASTAGTARDVTTVQAALATVPATTTSSFPVPVPPIPPARVAVVDVGVGTPAVSDQNPEETMVDHGSGRMSPGQKAG
jgi:hypothetical protein